MPPFQPSREKQLLGQRENESRRQQVFQKIPLQAQLRRKLQGHEDLEGRKEALRKGKDYLSKVILPTPWASGHPERGVVCSLKKVAVRFPTLVLLKGLEAFWLPLLLRL